MEEDLNKAHDTADSNIGKTNLARRAALVRAGKALAYAAPVTLLALKVDALPCSNC